MSTHITDPQLLAEIATALTNANPDQQLAMDIDTAGTGLWDDDLAEIFQAHYEPGALKQHAAAGGGHRG